MAVTTLYPPQPGVVDRAGRVFLDGKHGPAKERCVCRDCGSENTRCVLDLLARARSLANGAIEVILQPLRKRRSGKQNRYWHGVVVPMVATACGYNRYEHDAVHDELMRVLVGLKPDADPRLQIRVSSTELSTGEFNEDLIEQVQRWAAEKLNLVIPDPDPLWRERRARQKAQAAA